MGEMNSISLFLLTYVNDKTDYFDYNLKIHKNNGEVQIKIYEFYKNICCLDNENLVQELVETTEVRYLRKGEVIVHVGEVQNDVYFLISGIARGYFLDMNGKDVTDCFSFKCGSTAVSFGQLKMDVPSPMTIEVLEDGEFFCVPISAAMELQKKYLEITLLYNRLLIDALTEHWRLKQILNQYTAIQRYQWFLKEYPGLIYRVKGKYIASFLGMTPVTLSRLRRTLKEGDDQKGIH
mgnify:CR=1 FL=1